MLTRLLLTLAVIVWTVPILAQEIHVPAGPSLPGPVAGCRYTEWIPEAHVGPGAALWLVLWNPLPVDQYVEIVLFDDGSKSPPWNKIIPAETRTSLELLAGRRPYLSRLRAISAEIRWQHAGSSALASWPLIYDRPLILSEGKALVLCYDR